MSRRVILVNWSSITEVNIRRTLEVDLEKCAAVRTHKVIEGIVGVCVLFRPPQMSLILFCEFNFQI